MRGASFPSTGPFAPLLAAVCLLFVASPAEPANLPDRAPVPETLRPAAEAGEQPTARSSGEDIPLPESAPVPETVAPNLPETDAPVPEDKPLQPAEEASGDARQPSGQPLENAPADPPKPEFRPDKPSPQAAEPAEPPPPPDPRSAQRPDPSGQLPPEEIACRQRLFELGVKFDNRPAETDPAGCSIPYPLTVKSLGKDIGLHPDAEMNCAMAEAAARFAKDIVSPAAQNVFSQPLKSITQASAYVCRPRNGTRKLSEHAFGNALDISSFTLSDDTTVAVEPTPPEKHGVFVGKVRSAACGPFKTVLGPGDPDHSEHLHFDLAPRRHGGTVCE